MKSRTITLIAVCASAALLMAGCSGGSQPTTTGSGGAGGGTETISFSFYGESDEITAKQALIADFEKKYPNIKVEGTYTTGTQYPTKLETYFSSNTAPDVISIASDIVQPFVSRGVFADLTDRIKADNLSGLWDDQLQKPFTTSSTVFGVPWEWKSLAIAYNKDLFAKAGVPEPTSSWTEADLIADARAIAKLTDPSGKIYGFDPSWYLTWGMRNTYGNPNYDVDNRTMTATDNASYKHGLDLFAGLIKDGVSPAPSQGAAATAGFPGGLVGMQVIGAWDPSSYKEQIGDRFGWDLVRLPADSDFGAWTTPLFDDGLAISANSKHQDAAWTFIKYVTTDESAQQAAGTWGYPALNSVVKDFVNTFAEGVTPYNKQAFIDSPRVAWQSAGVWQSINDQESSLFDSVVQGQLTVDQMISQLQEQGTALLK